MKRKRKLCFWRAVTAPRRCLRRFAMTGFSRQEAMRLASSFGGGVGRMREICGALSGAFGHGLAVRL